MVRGGGPKEAVVMCGGERVRESERDKHGEKD